MAYLTLMVDGWFKQQVTNDPTFRLQAVENGRQLHSRHAIVVRRMEVGVGIQQISDLSTLRGKQTADFLLRKKWKWQDF